MVLPILHEFYRSGAVDHKKRHHRRPNKMILLAVWTLVEWFKNWFLERICFAPRLVSATKHKLLYLWIFKCSFNKILTYTLVNPLTHVLTLKCTNTFEQSMALVRHGEVNSFQKAPWRESFHCIDKNMGKCIDHYITSSHICACINCSNSSLCGCINISCCNVSQRKLKLFIVIIFIFWSDIVLAFMGGHTEFMGFCV